MSNCIFKRGDIFWAILRTENDSRVIRGCRPVVVVSNDSNNRYSPVVTVVPITSQKKKALPTHVELSGFGLDKCSVAIAEQIQTLDKTAFVKRIGSLDGTDKMAELDLAIMKQLNVA